MILFVMFAKKLNSVFGTPLVLNAITLMSGSTSFKPPRSPMPSTKYNVSP